MEDVGPNPFQEDAAEGAEEAWTPLQEGKLQGNRTSANRPVETMMEQTDPDIAATVQPRSDDGKAEGSAPASHQAKRKKKAGIRN